MGQKHSTPKEEPKLEEPAALGLSEALSQYYQRKILPLENASKYGYFYTPALTAAELNSLPCILLLGQYSVGKTSFIRYLINDDYPGMVIGPEPTTESFAILQYGKVSRAIPGVTTINQQNFQFKGLQKFSNSLLRRCYSAFCPNQMLKYFVIIDTPGMLAGDSECRNRGYDFASIVQYFAEKADVILLMFDAQKLDISDEMKSVMRKIQKYEEKIRVILNKADMFDAAALNRVRCNLTWTLGRTMQQSQMPAVYVGSFWDQPLKHADLRELFQKDEQELFDLLRKLPRLVSVRRLDDIVKRAKQVRLHALLMVRLVQRSDLWWKSRVLSQFKNSVYQHFLSEFNLSSNDILSADAYVHKLKNIDLKRLRRITPDQFRAVEQFLHEDVAKMMKILPSETSAMLADVGQLQGLQIPHIGSEIETLNTDWQAIAAIATRKNWAEEFNMLPQEDGRIEVDDLKVLMNSLDLRPSQTKQILNLVDVNPDHKLSEEEFYLFRWLLSRAIADRTIPKELMSFQRPLSKKHSYT